MIIEMNSVNKMGDATNAILENLLDAVLVVNSNGEIIYSNKAAGDLFALPANQLTGKPFGFPITPYEVQEIEIIKQDELLTVQMLASHISWDGQIASLLSLRDITAQKKVLRELAKQKLLLEKTSEENALFASLASHDLKEPVRKILIFSDRLLASNKMPEHERVQLKKIQSSAKRMNSLIGGITALSKITFVPHTFSQVNLKTVVEEVLADLELQIEEKGATVEVSALSTIDAVHDEMYQLFLNLIANGLKYSKQKVAPRITITEVVTGEDYVCINCTDNGIGFDNGYGAKLFQPFQRLHTTEYEGMGIGLTLCQRIVDVHNGRITAQGAPGVGATFSVLLPRQQNLNEA